MIKALFINGSPRKQWNTAQLLQKALEGARDGGAETEMVHLYDRDMNYKGCMSCFACKVKGGRKGVCLFKDDLQPIMEKAVEADVLVCGSPVYCGYPTAGLRALMERLIFPGVNYADFRHPVVLKPKHSATIFTMNCPNEAVYQANAYDILMDTNAKQLGMFGPTEIMYSFDTLQFNDYSRYDAEGINGDHKKQWHDTHFADDLNQAYNLGKRLVEECR